jgi:hypothetical protein
MMPTYASPTHVRVRELTGPGLATHRAAIAPLAVERRLQAEAASALAPSTKKATRFFAVVYTEGDGT